MAARFITFEGLDGSGKSTHLERAARWLEAAGVPCVTAQEPGGTPLGDELRRLFLDVSREALDGTVETLLLFASRRQLLLDVVEPALARGSHVLCDRFTDSTFAYQGYGRGLDLDMVLEVDRLATGCRRPDLTLLFDLPAQAARGRGLAERRRKDPRTADRLDRERLEFYERVRAGYLELAGAEPRRFRVIDSTGPVADTEAAVRRALAGLLPW